MKRAGGVPRPGIGTRPAPDATFLAFVLEQLEGLPDVESRSMFGGHGLYQAGQFFAIVHGGRVYFRVDDASRPEYERHGMESFMPRPRQTLGRYYEVPPEVLEDASQAARWARRAVHAATAGG